MTVESRASLEQISKYKPARSIESVKRELGLAGIIKLAGNENSLGCSPLAKQAIQNAFSELSLYADSNCTRLRERLAEILAVNGDQIVFGDGSFELLSLIAQAYINPGEESIIAEPSFGWYKIVTWEMAGKVVSVPLNRHKVDLDAIRDRVTEKTRVIWLCNPNNPTGTFFDQKQLGRFLSSLPDHILVVLDEAYYEFVEDGSYPESTELIERFPNIIVLRTFSKVYGLASLRIGYGISSPEVAAALNKIRPPINVSLPAQAAALASLDDPNFKAKVLENNRRSKKLYYHTLEEWGVEYIPTQGNFIMLRTGLDSGYVVNEYLKKGIMIRSGDDFDMPTWLRVTIGRYEENELVLDVLQGILREMGDGKAYR